MATKKKKDPEKGQVQGQLKSSGALTVMPPGYVEPGTKTQKPAPKTAPKPDKLPVQPTDPKKPSPKPDRLPVQPPAPQPDKLPVQPPSPKPDKLPVQPPRPDGLPVQPTDPRKTALKPDGLPVQPMTPPKPDGLPVQPLPRTGEQPSFMNLGQNTPGIDGLYSAPSAQSNPGLFSTSSSASPQGSQGLGFTPQPDGLPVQPMPRTDGGVVGDWGPGGGQAPETPIGDWGPGGGQAPDPNSPAPANNIYRHPNNPSVYFNSDGSVYNGTPVYSGGPGNWEQTGWSDNPGSVPPPDGLPVQPPGPPPPDGLPVQPPGNGNAQVVPGPADPNDPNQINVADYAGNLVTDPRSGFSNDMLLSENLTGFTEEQKAAGEIGDLTKPDFGRLNQTAAQGKTTQAQTATANQVDPRQSPQYQAAQTADKVAQQDMQGAVGQVDPRAVIEAPQIDTEAVAAGTTGTGAALKDFASLDISNIIDTSTAAGKALAAQLGEGNYVDSKATLKGQLEILQSEFEGPNGEAKIPSWAAGTARNVSKIAAFKGMSGTAATSAMAQALLESSIAVAQQDAQFFQTVTIQNLNNKQQATINRANVLAQMDMANLDSRTAAAVQNSKNFMDMSLANLSNEQQARILNTQNRVQSILEDAKEQNVASRFNIEQGNQVNQFYDSLNASIDQFNTAQTNAMEQFNSAESNKMSQFNVSQENAMRTFNAQLEDSREQFYLQNQYNVDVANAKWRQELVLTENRQAFEAMALDVKNMVGVSQEQLNRIWDRSDSLLDYIWKSAENELDRDAAIAMAHLNAKLQSDAEGKKGIGSIIGTIAGSLFSKLKIF